MKKIIFGLLLLPTAIWAQTITLTGKIVKKPWSKTAQSYCAQGGGYLVLSTKDGKEHVLDFSKNNTDGSGFINKTVSLNGQKVEKVITKDPNSMEQRPISAMGEDDGNYRCEVFEVHSVKAGKNGKNSKPNKK